MASVIERINQNAICCGCGLCVTLCPYHALNIDWNSYGELQPSFVDNAKCNSCGFCLTVCPFASDNPNETDIGKYLYENLDDINYKSETGYYLSLAAGAVNNEQQRLASASGGIASCFLGMLLDQKIVDYVILVKKNGGGGRGYMSILLQKIRKMWRSHEALRTIQPTYLVLYNIYWITLENMQQLVFRVL